MAGATAYEGATRAEGADTAAGRAEAARGGGKMAVGQSVSNRRAKRSSYADSCARRHGAVSLRSEVANGDPAVLRIPRQARASRRSALTDGFPASSRNPGAPPRRRCHHRCQCRLFRRTRSPDDLRCGRSVIPELRGLYRYSDDC